MTAAWPQHPDYDWETFVDDVGWAVRDLGMGTKCAFLAAEDFPAEVYLRINVDLFDPSVVPEGSFGGWVRSQIKFRLLDVYRHFRGRFADTGKRQMGEVLTSVEEPSIDMWGLSPDCADQALAAMELEKLAARGDRDSQVMQSVFIQGISQREVADALGLSESMISFIVRRWRRFNCA